MAGAPLEASVTEFGAGALWAIFQALALAVPHAFQVGDFRLLVFVTAEREGGNEESCELDFISSTCKSTTPCPLFFVFS